MKKTLLLIVISLLSLTLLGCNKEETYLDGAFAVVYQDNIPYLINKKLETLAIDKYDHIVPEFGEYLLVYNDDGKTREYGYIKNTGEEVIKPRYSSATIFSEGKAIVGLKDQLMIINPAGEVLYTFPADLHSSKLYREDMLVVEQNGRYSYLSSDFKVADVWYDYAGDFQNGYAVVGKLDDNKIKYGLIDKSFKQIIPFEYDFLDNYSDGYVRVGYEIDVLNNKYKYRFMRLDGTFLTDETGNYLSYDYALNFANGCALVGNYTISEMYGIYKEYQYIDTKGQEPFDFHFTKEGEGIYYFDSLVNRGDTLIGVYRERAGGAGAWYVLELFVLDDYKELLKLDFTIPEEFKGRENLIYYKNPYEMTSFKVSEFYDSSLPLSRVRIYSGDFGLVDGYGNYVLPAEYDDLFY